jgi:membrane peptidoglycan carboxypeptidase
LYQHTSAGTQVLDRSVALTAVDTLKSPLSRAEQGTARNALSSLPFPASGKTGTQVDNTNSWFVGGTTALTTAVWVGNPNGYVSMVKIPEFLADEPSVDEVQGGTYPARIWRLLMEPASAAAPPADWEPAPPPARPAVRLYLPGNECLFRAVGVTNSDVAPTTVPNRGETQNASPGNRGETQNAVPPTTVPPADVTTTTAAPVLRPLPSDTTIAPDNLDPKAPLPFTALQTVVRPCQPVVIPPSNPSD